LHIESAERVASVLGQLKGAAMKVGQQLAMAAGNLDVPDEVRAALATLHTRAEPVPFSNIQRTIERELNGTLPKLFSNFDPEPLGTASLGQAHGATLRDGTNVVVKVLHDGMAQSLSSDLSAFRALMVGGRLLGRERSELDAAFMEVKARLEEELDYLQEAANLTTFAHRFDGDERVRIPRLHSALSGPNVLTMDRLPGVPLDAFLQRASAAARQRAGQTLAETYYEMAFRHQLLHADPHPGNYLFEEDGRVGLLDFGCVKRFDEFWIANYARTALAAFDGDREAFLDGVRRIDGWHGDGQAAADALWRFGDTLATPFRDGPYAIGDHADSMLERLRPIAKSMLRLPEVHVPRDVIFLHRSLAGLYSLARQMHTTVDLGAIARPQMTYALRRADGLLPQRTLG